jgi:hypothetical protein
MAPPPRGGVGAGVRLELRPRDGVAAPLRADGEPPDRLAARRLAGAALRAAGALAFAAAGGCAIAAAAGLAAGTAAATTAVGTDSDGDGDAAGRALGVGATVGTPSTAAGGVAGAEALADGGMAGEGVCCSTSPAPPTWAPAESSVAEERREAAGREEELEERLAMAGRGVRGGVGGAAAPMPHSDQAVVAGEGLSHPVPRNR